MPPTQIGPYRIVRVLGEGGMGTVYEAMQEPIQRRVALKILLPQYVQNPDVLTRFFNEARVVNLIEHPSIVQVSDYGQAADGTAYLVMEYLRGETLSSRLARLLAKGERLGVAEALQLAAQIADALAAAHEKSVVHRDLKPANVMWVRDSAVPGGGRAKILDFGIAKLTQGQAQGTGTHVVMGTPQYMSPEQCRGAGGVDDKTDVYALGVILYEMLAGRPPFLAESPFDYMSQHVLQEPPPLRDFAPTTPADVATLVHRLLIKDKAARPPMQALNAELVRLLSQLSSDISGTTPALPPSPKADSDATRQYVVPVAPPSTLGGSLGEPLGPAAKRRARTLSLLAGVAGICLLLTATVHWLRPHAATPATSPQRIQPSAAPAATQRPVLPPSSPPAVDPLAPPKPVLRPPLPNPVDKRPQTPNPTPTLGPANLSQNPSKLPSQGRPQSARPAPPGPAKNLHGEPVGPPHPKPPRPAQSSSYTERAKDYEP